MTLLAILLRGAPTQAADQRGLLPVAIETDTDVAVVPGVPTASTSTKQTTTPRSSGTIFLAWADRSPSFSNNIIVAEWGIAEQKILVRRVLRTCKQYEACTVRLARSADRVIALIGGHMDNVTISLEVITLGLDLAEKKSRVLGVGGSPILDADSRFVLVGAWEDRTPVAAPIHQRDTIIQPRNVLSLRVLDPSSLQTVGARVFRGAHLLSPNFIGPRASRAACLGGGEGAGAWVALPDDQLRVLHVDVPSLATKMERTFPRTWDGNYEDTTAALEPVGANMVLVVGRHLRLLSRGVTSITMTAEEGASSSMQYAYDPTKAAFVSDRDSPASVGGIPIRPNVIPTGSSATVSWAFGHRVIVGEMVDDDVAPAKWGIAIVP